MRAFETIRCLSVAAGATLFATAAAADTCPVPDSQPATQALVDMLADDPALAADLAQSIVLGQRVNPDPVTNPVTSLEDYYDYIDALLTYDPRNIDTGLARGRIKVSMAGKAYCQWNILDLIVYGYFLVDRQITTDPRGQLQFLNADFSAWMGDLEEAWGRYLETSDSARYLPEFEGDAFYGDWYCPAEPYDSFQAFFTRELCADTFPNGTRPVEGYDDPRTVVSIGDSNSAGTWPISADGKLVTGYDRVSDGGRLIKGKLYSDIHEFILGGEDETVLATFGEIDPTLFDGGVFTHQFLDVNNYHRLHVPVAGEIVYMRHMKAGTRLKAHWKPPLDPTLFGVADQVGYYDPADTPDWQFGQTRLVLGIRTEDYGTVIATPMGMAQVSAIQLRDWVREGAGAQKGWEFANFAFGGSDFVILFEPRADFRLTVPLEPSVPPGSGVNYQPSLQGEKYGCFGGVTDCSDTPPADPGTTPPPIPDDA